jgi:ComF family protein
LSNSTFTEIFGDFISLFFPPYCLSCEDILIKGEDTICTRCLAEMPKTDYHLVVENEFHRKLFGRIPVRYVMALYKFSKKSRVQELLHALKYKNHPEIGFKLGKVYGAILSTAYKNEFDIIVPVPLHKTRLRQRGYNQSVEFGRGVAEMLEIPCREEIIERVTVTETQTKKTKLLRWQNVSEVFKIVSPQDVEDKRIPLVDDVITTGATIEACAHELLQGMCKDVSIVCIAAAQ